MINVISIKDVCFNYSKDEILKNISVDIEGGKLYALFGPNGSGKSTLLKCIAGLFKCKSGSIEIMGNDIKKLSNKKLSQFVSYVPQENKTSFPFTVEEVVLMGRTPYINNINGPSIKDLEKVEESIKIVGIEKISQKLYTELSGGQRQLVLLARALAQDTPIMVLDEPTSALDFKNQLNVWTILKKLKSYDKTIICCTHDPNHVSWFCDKVVVMKNGQIIEDGFIKDTMNDKTLDELYGEICSIGSLNEMKIIVPTI